MLLATESPILESSQGSGLTTANTSPAAATVPGRLEFIEGLRALAALWVVLSHIWIYQFGLIANEGRLGLFSNWLLYSHLAVDVFIVLSGFCLTLPPQREGALRGGAAGFLRRRARRILPPLFLALALSVGIAVGLQKFNTGLWRLDLRALAANLLLVQDIDGKTNVFDSPLWSVAVEWRLSLVFPLLLWVLRRGGLAAVLLPSAVLGYGLTAWMLWNAPDALMASPWYLLLFALGMCSASLAFPHREASTATGWKWLAGAALLALALLLRAYPVAGSGGVNFGRHMPIIDAAAGALTAALLVGLSRRRAASPHFSVALLTWPPLCALGRFSYSLYLTHAPLLSVMHQLLGIVPGMATAAPLVKCAVMAVVGLPLLLILAYAFFLTCERPFWNFRTPNPRPRPPVSPITGILKPSNNEVFPQL